MPKYTVQGKEHASKAALQLEWRKRVKRIVKRKPPVVQCTGQQPKRAKGVAPKHESKRTVLSVKEGEWFTEAAALFPKTRARLYPSEEQHNTALCRRMTRVFVAKAGLAFGRYRENSYTAKADCIFRRATETTTQFRRWRAISANPGLNQKHKAAWCRNKDK